ncbi:AraC family transcriptional regulator [Pedobacter sp. L105]|uniref:helix-turn-helix domain-containing protein n=1 Tax=Pedobacter sp. L105 TaxID=1641871 RepID=UPI00131AAB2F|nr:helix-turn-helix transcriptional regulator [Pedobacter sp. L105]
MKPETPYLINSISEHHRILGLEKPKHPLISVVNYGDIKSYTDERLKLKSYNFYTVSIKKGFVGKMKYGQQYYDFDEGVMVFLSPKQVIAAELSETIKLSGWSLLIHPDFIQPYALSKKIKEYGFFSYAVNEALHLSPEEEEMVETTMKNIRLEYDKPIDHYSQDIIVSQIELLLNYCNRFYNRQFITRKKVNNDLLVQLEDILSDYFDKGKVKELGLPTVQDISAQLHISPTYLSDMLRSVTGRNAQQHITDKLMERAKELLSTTSLSISEIAYQLGYGYPQSFNKLFKNKTNLSPLEFRASFN